MIFFQLSVECNSNMNINFSLLSSWSTQVADHLQLLLLELDSCIKRKQNWSLYNPSQYTEEDYWTELCIYTAPNYD
jgi:hypothetical protein